MRPILFTALLALTMLTAFQQKDPMALLQQARAKFHDHASVSYQYTSLWPDPAGTIDTASAQCDFTRAKGAYFNYDYVMRTDLYDVAFIGQQFRQVEFAEKKVVLYPDDQPRLMKRFASENITVAYSPITLIDQAWSYAKDTVIRKIRFSEYQLAEMDTVYDGKHIRTERHIFINASNALLERYERRTFFNGKSSQIIVFLFSNYNWERKPKPLSYTPPPGYRTEIFGQGDQLEVLKEGAQAPLFTSVDMNGKPVSLEALRGKKVLLDFSVINCGYCKMAADHLTRNDFKLPADVVCLYINPMDKKEKLAVYAQKSNLPFTIVPEARDIGKQYGVSGYPTFYLINEQGIIENVTVGYRKEFIDGLSSR